MIREAVYSDIDDIASIYNYYIRNSTATFEEQEVDAQEIWQRVSNVQQSGYSWLVANDEDSILGYAYAAQWKDRSAYRHTAEVSVYLSHTVQNSGLGTRLYQALFNTLKNQNIHVAIGGITLPNPASVALHEKFGMHQVAHFKEVGFTFGQWLDVGYWQVNLNQGGPKGESNAPPQSASNATRPRNIKQRMQIRDYHNSDWKEIWAILKEVFREGETFPNAIASTEEDAYDFWINKPKHTLVALIDNHVVGSYHIKDNQAGLGSHVANAGYVLSPNYQGQGVGLEIATHSLNFAASLGYKAMQFNLVVSTNTASVTLWHKLGFSRVGTLPKAFNHKKLGLVDAFVMYKWLQ